MMQLPQVRVDIPRPEDRGELLAMNRASVHLHRPWIDPPTRDWQFDRYLQRVSVESEEGFFVREVSSGQLVGVFTLSNIIRGLLQSGSLGYYGSALAAGQGLMTAGLQAVLARIFLEMELHRVEANIQPGNHRSLALVKRCGFQREGYSPRYLKIDGQWQDHERWALLVEDWTH